MSAEDKASTPTSTEMKIDPARVKVLVENLASVKSRIQAANKSGRDVSRAFFTFSVLHSACECEDSVLLLRHG